MLKKRRNVRGFDCVRNLKEDCWNVELKEGTIEEICWMKSKRVTLNEPQEMVELLWWRGG